MLTPGTDRCRSRDQAGAAVGPRDQVGTTRPPQLSLLSPLVALVVLSVAATASAQASGMRARWSAAGGALLSADQRDLYDFELPAVESTVRVGWQFDPAVVLELGTGGGAYLASEGGAGGLADATLGVEAAVREGPARMWISVHAGGGWTGPLVRPVMRIAAGVDLSAHPAVGVGPSVGYLHLFQLDGENQSDDAVALTLGLSVTLRQYAPVHEVERAAAPPQPPPLPVFVSPEPLPPASPPPLPAGPPVDDTALTLFIDEAVGLRPRELLVPVLFGFDSTQLVPCTLPSLVALRDHLAAHPNIELLEIQGHADSRGADDYNEALGRRRAEAIRDWLVEHGVSEERLQVSSRGAANPALTEATDDAHTQNRRVRFRVLREAR